MPMNRLTYRLRGVQPRLTSKLFQFPVSFIVSPNVDIAHPAADRISRYRPQIPGIPLTAHPALVNVNRVLAASAGEGISRGTGLNVGEEEANPSIDRLKLRPVPAVVYVKDLTLTRPCS